MRCDAPPNENFALWFNLLSDEEQIQVLELLRRTAEELDCPVNSNTPIPHHALNLRARISSQFSLN